MVKITYVIPQDVRDMLDNVGAADLGDGSIEKFIYRAQDIITERTGMVFESTGTTEYYDWNASTRSTSPSNQGGFFGNGRYDTNRSSVNNRLYLNNFPIVSVTELSTNGAGATGADSWTARTENTGSGGTFILKQDIGAVDFVGYNPRFGDRSIKVEYFYGKLDASGTCPGDIKRLTVLLATQQVAQMKASSAQFNNVNDISIEGISLKSGIRSTTSYLADIRQEVDEMFAKVSGEFRTSRMK